MMNLGFLPGTTAVRVTLQVDAGKSGGVGLDPATPDPTTLRPLVGGGLGAPIPPDFSDESTREWRNIPRGPDGVFLALEWQVLDPVADTTTYTATITVRDDHSLGLLPPKPDENPMVLEHCQVGDVTPGIGNDARPISIT